MFTRKSVILIVATLVTTLSVGCSRTGTAIPSSVPMQSAQAPRAHEPSASRDDAVRDESLLQAPTDFEIEIAPKTRRARGTELEGQIRPSLTTRESQGQLVGLAPPDAR